jgi:hypothetical protein
MCMRTSAGGRRTGPAKELEVLRLLARRCRGATCRPAIRFAQHRENPSACLYRRLGVADRTRRETRPRARHPLTAGPVPCSAVRIHRGKSPGRIGGSDDDNPPGSHRGWGHGTCGIGPKRLPTSRFEEVHRDVIVLAAGPSGAPGTGRAHWPKADSKPRRIPTPGSAATHRFKEVHILPLVSGQALRWFSAQIHPIPRMGRSSSAAQ